MSEVLSIRLIGVQDRRKTGFEPLEIPLRNDQSGPDWGQRNAEHVDGTSDPHGVYLQAARRLLDADGGDGKGVNGQGSLMIDRLSVSRSYPPSRSMSIGQANFLGRIANNHCKPG